MTVQLVTGVPVLLITGPVGVGKSTVLAEAAWLLRQAQVPHAATVLTSDGHERFRYAVREAWGTPVLGPVPGEAQRDAGYEGEPDRLYAEGDPPPGACAAPTAGPSYPGPSRRAAPRAATARARPAGAAGPRNGPASAVRPGSPRSDPRCAPAAG